MREILFRGKRLDNGEWVEGCLAAFDLIAPNYPEDTFNATGEYYGQIPYVGFIEVDPSTVDQFTGLCDKNGKKIFEGDIVHWDAKEWGCPFSELVVWDYSLLSMRDNDWPEWGEVIGNIHDNPELLEGEG